MEVTAKVLDEFGDLDEKPDPIEQWLVQIIPVYQKITGQSELKTSLGFDRAAGGPLVRFLIAASQPLGIHATPTAWRNRVRRLKKNKNRQLPARVAQDESASEE